jgi:carbamate kinase
MGPKIEAVIAFLESGGHKAYITNIQVLEQTFAGQAGTQFLLN